MLDDLFTFPVILVDGRNEESKFKENERLGIATDEEDELDIAIGEAEYPFFDFIGIEDRWMPDTPSFQKAMDGNFNACLVKFSNVGHLLVPWKKEKFKTELASFIKKREESKEDDKAEPKKVTVIKFTPEMLANMVNMADKAAQLPLPPENEEKKDE